MRSLKKIFSVLSILVLVLLFTSIKASANSDIPNKIIANTGNKILGSAEYNGFNMYTQKVSTEYGVGYCLEVYKPYPYGEMYTLQGDTNSEIRNILLAGYPNRTAKELGLNSEEDAYAATQLALWSAIEGFNTNKLNVSKPEVLTAARSVLKDASNKSNLVVRYETKVYTINNKLQDLVLTFKVGEELPKPPTEDNGDNTVEPEEPEDSEDTDDGVDVIPPLVDELPHTGNATVFLTLITGVGAIIVGKYLIKK